MQVSFFLCYLSSFDPKTNEKSIKNDRLCLPILKIGDDRTTEYLLQSKRRKEGASPWRQSEAGGRPADRSGAAGLEKEKENLISRLSVSVDLKRARSSVTCGRL